MQGVGDTYREWKYTESGYIWNRDKYGNGIYTERGYTRSRDIYEKGIQDLSKERINRVKIHIVSRNIKKEYRTYTKREYT